METCLRQPLQSLGPLCSSLSIACLRPTLLSNLSNLLSLGSNDLRAAYNFPPPPSCVISPFQLHVLEVQCVLQRQASATSLPHTVLMDHATAVAQVHTCLNLFLQMPWRRLPAAAGAKSSTEKCKCPPYSGSCSGSCSGGSCSSWPHTWLRDFVPSTHTHTHSHTLAEQLEAEPVLAGDLNFSLKPNSTDACILQH